MSAALSDLQDVASKTVEEWVDVEPQVVLVLKRKSDGLEIRFCPNRESYQEALDEGVVAFTPHEVKQLCALATQGEGAEAFAARVVEAKRVMPGIKLSEVKPT